MDFQTFLSNKIKERGLTIKRVSELSGIALKHLENLNSGNFSDLPAAPYLRGYFEKLGQILNFDDESAWKIFKEENSIASSGLEDKLPKNRFAKKAPPKKIIFGIIIIAVIATIIVVRLPKIIGQPVITVFYPNENLTQVNENEILIRGELKNGDKVFVDKENIILNPDGTWQKNILLEPGLNTIEISAKKFLGREAKITRQVLYENPDEFIKESTSSVPLN